MPSGPPIPRKPPFSDIRLMVFDLDGTLLNTFEDIAAAANYSLALCRKPRLSAPEIQAFVGGGGRLLMQRCLGGQADEETLDRAFEAWRDYYLRHPADFAKPYPGAAQTLAELRRRGIHTATLSNKLHALSVEALRLTGFEPLLDAIRGERPPIPRKPDPAELQNLMREFQATPAQTLMVGDGTADMLVARNAGVAAVGVSWGVCTAEELRRLGATIVIDAFPDLLSLLSGETPPGHRREPMARAGG